MNNIEQEKPNEPFRRVRAGKRNTCNQGTPKNDQSLPVKRGTKRNTTEIKPNFSMSPSKRISDPLNLKKESEEIKKSSKSNYNPR